MTVDFSSYTRGQWHPPQNLKYLLSKPLLSSVVTLCVDDGQDSPWLSLLPRFKVDTILQWHVYSPQQMNPIGCPSPSVYQACGYSQTLEHMLTNSQSAMVYRLPWCWGPSLSVHFGDLVNGSLHTKMYLLSSLLATEDKAPGWWGGDTLDLISS